MVRAYRKTGRWSNGKAKGEMTMKESTITAIKSLQDGVAIYTYWQNRARKEQK